MKIIFFIVVIIIIVYNKKKEISAEEMLISNNDKKLIKISVDENYTKYNLKPLVISKKKLVCLNAQKLAFYTRRKLKNPILVLWILTKRTNHLTYANKRLFETAWDMNIQIKFIQTNKIEMLVTQEGLENIYYKSKKVKKLPDIVLARLGSKIDYYGLSILRQLEEMGVLVLNTFQSIEIAKDKLYSLQHLASHHLPIPKTMIMRLHPLSKETIKTIEKEFDYPIIVKKSIGSQGKGVLLIKDQRQLKDIVGMINTNTPMIIQEFIEMSKGRDIRVIVIGGRAIGAMMRIAASGYKSNFHQGGYAKKVNLSYEVEWLAIEAAKVVGLDVAGVDILMDKNTYKICEVNSSPGFEAFELTTGIDVPKNLLNFIKLRLGVRKKKGKKKKNIIKIPIMAEHRIVIPKKKKNVDVKDDNDDNVNIVINQNIPKIIINDEKETSTEQKLENVQDEL